MKAAGALGDLVSLWCRDNQGGLRMDLPDGGASANGRLVFDRINASEPSDRSFVPANVTRAKTAWAEQHLTGPARAGGRVDGRRAPHRPGSTEARALAEAWTARREALANRLAATRRSDTGQPAWFVALVRLHVSRQSALAVGHSGGGTAAETSLSLHPVTGQPWLPGSGLKGAARRLREGDGEHNAPDGGEPTADALYGSASGDGGGAVGRVRVLDAVAHSDVAVAAVVMTPHASGYYRDPATNQPGRWENPVPVPFPVVTAGKFTTLIVGRDRDEVEQAAGDLADAASWLGLGAKTGAGFGYVEATVEPLGEDR